MSKTASSRSRMRIKVLDCFSEKREPRRLASWEGMPPALEHFRADPVAVSEKDAFVAHFAALGYLDLESENASGVHHEMRATNAWNMGQALLNSARPLEALPYLEEAFYYRPEQVHLAEPLARCQLLLGLTDEALTTCESLRDYADSYPNIALKLVDIYRLAGQVDVAFELLQQAADNGLRPETVAFHRGLCHMRNGEHQKALEAYEAAQTAEESILINLAKASSLIGLKRYGDAESLVDSALAASLASLARRCHLPHGSGLITAGCRAAPIARADQWLLKRTLPALCAASWTAR